MMPPPGVPRPDAAASEGARRHARSRARSRRESVAQSGTAARPSVESRRVRQRDSRPACRSMSTSRRCCRRTTRALASTTTPTSSGVSPVLLESYLHCRRAHQRAGRRRPEDAADGRAVPRAAGRVAGSPHRRSAARHRRRPADSDDAAARRRVSVPGQAVPDEPRHDARPRVSASARDLRRRRARSPRLVRRRQGDRGVQRQPDDDR